MTDFVHPNVPCIIKNAIPSNDASGGATGRPLTLTLDEIINHVDEDAKITVDVTPDGHGDCIRSVVVEANHHHDAKQQQQRQERRMFVKPHEKNMGIGKFRDLLRRGRSGCDDRTNSHNGKIVNGNADAGVVPKIDSNGLEVFPLHHHSNCTDKAHSITDTESEVGRPPVVYYSRQNDCLRTEVSKLFSTQLFPPTFPFAEEAFGTGPPDAINLWIGNERSVSSMHKDHYENLFYVCSGQKEFVLCPPADVVFLQEGEFSSGTFCPRMHDNNEAGGESNNESNHSSWTVVADDNNTGNREEGLQHEMLEATTRWIEPDIKKYMENKANKATEEFPLLSKAHPIKVLVSEGEMLYIPSLWYHRVTQTCETVGVNYWYDMKFDSPHWCYFNFLQNLKVKQEGQGHRNNQ
mmetsp:Transcript_9793/g.16042  ORF Transcript_9793/g.16042 Transcript_9793/m.16042 type:complete len:407 (+) Transcript_9793:154-1374(+)